MRRSAFFLLLFWIGLGTGFAQQSSKQQKQLEAQRLQLKNEIKQINSLLFSNTKTRKNALSEVEDLQVKLNVRSKLIKVTNQQANLLTRRIGLNERTIANQRKRSPIPKMHSWIRRREHFQTCHETHPQL